MFVYTALGDSITAGDGLRSPSLAYPHLLIAMLRSRSQKAYGYVLAEPGWTSGNLLNALLERDPLPIENSSVVSIWIGGDNLIAAGMAMFRGAKENTIAASLSRFRRDLSKMIHVIHRNSKAKIVVCTQYNPFPNSPIAVKAVNALNAAIKQCAKEQQARIAPAHLWFEGRQAELIIGYRTGKIEDVLNGRAPIHPNVRGHQLIAQELLPYLVK